MKCFVAALVSALFLLPSHAQDQPFDLQFGFDSESGFTQGSIDEQKGWEVVHGEAEIEGNPLRILPADDPQTHIRWETSLPTEDRLLTIKISLFMAGSNEDPSIVPVARIHGVDFAVLRWDYNDTVLLVSDGMGGWIQGNRISTDMDLTLRFDRMFQSSASIEISGTPGITLSLKTLIPTHSYTEQAYFRVR